MRYCKRYITIDLHVSARSISTRILDCTSLYISLVQHKILGTGGYVVSFAVNIERKSSFCIQAHSHIFILHLYIYLMLYLTLFSYIMMDGYSNVYPRPHMHIELIYYFVFVCVCESENNLFWSSQDQTLVRRYPHPHNII